MPTIYENIQRLNQLANYGGNVQTHAAACREDIQGRAQEALEIVGERSRFAAELEEIKQFAVEFEGKISRLNELLTQVIKAEADRMLGSAG